MNGARGSPSAASFLLRGQAVHALFLTEPDMARLYGEPAAPRG